MVIFWIGLLWHAMKSGTQDLGWGMKFILNQKLQFLLGCHDSLSPNKGVSYPHKSVSYPQNGFSYPHKGVLYPDKGVSYPQKGFLHPHNCQP
jgi:hypothetical protein